MTSNPFQGILANISMVKTFLMPSGEQVVVSRLPAEDFDPENPFCLKISTEPVRGIDYATQAEYVEEPDRDTLYINFGQRQAEAFFTQAQAVIKQMADEF